MLYIPPPLENCNTEILDSGEHADLPAGFDANQLPIIAQHWFGWEPIGAAAARVVQDIKFRRKARRLHAKEAYLSARDLPPLPAHTAPGTVL